MSVTDNVGNSVTDTSNIALVNPYRYRSYYYDSETSLYYLNSRYYNPEVGRFVNADEIEYIIYTHSILSHNLFTYCNNDSVDYFDPYGNIALISCLIIGAVAGAILGGATGACISYAKYKKIKWKYILVGVLAGAVFGAIEGYSLGITVKASSTTILTAKKYATSFKINSKIARQMSRRGWTNALIKETILKNVGRKALNKATKNAATAYFTSAGSYVVIDNVTKEIIQISNRLDIKWVVDITINLLKSDVFIR